MLCFMSLRIVLTTRNSALKKSKSSLFRQGGPFSTRLVSIGAEDSMNFEGQRTRPISYGIVEKKGAEINRCSDVSIWSEFVWIFCTTPSMQWVLEYILTNSYVIFYYYKSVIFIFIIFLIARRAHPRLTESHLFEMKIKCHTPLSYQFRLIIKTLKADLRSGV